MGIRTYRYLGLALWYWYAYQGLAPEPLAIAALGPCFHRASKIVYEVFLHTLIPTLSRDKPLAQAGNNTGVLCPSGESHHTSLS